MRKTSIVRLTVGKGCVAWGFLEHGEELATVRGLAGRAAGGKVRERVGRLRNRLPEETFAGAAAVAHTVDLAARGAWPPRALPF